MIYRPVGIDLGVAHSVMATVSNTGHSEVVRDPAGNLLIPSAVYFDDTRVYAGEEAVLRGGGMRDRLAAGAVGELGKREFHQPLHGLHLPPEVIVASLLNKLRGYLTARLNSSPGIVLAIPAYFGELQRHALADAAAMASVPVLEILNAPIAAVLAYAEVAAGQPLAAAAQPRRVLVYDLRGAVFETALITLTPGQCVMLGHRHDSELGGPQWDARVVDYVAERFIRQFGVDLRDDPKQLEYLLGRAARAKRSLSLREVATMNVPHDKQTFELKLPRSVFAEVTHDLLDRTVGHAETLLAGAGCQWPQIDEVVLLGAAAFMPSVRARFRELTGRETATGVHPDEVVARGAALYARSLVAPANGTRRWPRINVVNVATHGLGIEGVDVASGRKVNKTLIRRGAALPAKTTRTFTTKTAGQKNVTLVVLEGEDDDPQRCTTIGKAIISNLPPDVTQDWPIDVTYEYTANGRLKIDAQVRYVECGVHLEMVRSGALHEKQVARWKEAVAPGGGLSALRTVLEGEQPPPTVEVTVPPPAAAAAVSWADLTRNYARQLLGALRFHSPAAPEVESTAAANPSSAPPAAADAPAAKASSPPAEVAAPKGETPTRPTQESSP